MTASALAVSAWIRRFQPRASPSRAAMLLACSSPGLVIAAATQCRAWNRRDWPGTDSSSWVQPAGGGPCGGGTASGGAGRGRRVILARPAKDS